MQRFGFICFVLFGFTLMGCGRDTDAKKDKVYDIKGKVVSVAPEKKTVRLDHEDIPGLMGAMEMNFDIAEAKTVEGLQPGDMVQGRLKAADGKYLILELKKR